MRKINLDCFKPRQEQLLESVRRSLLQKVFYICFFFVTLELFAIAIGSNNGLKAATESQADLPDI